MPVFALENSATPNDLVPVLEALLRWLHAPSNEDLLKSFTVWIRRVLLPGRMPGVEFENVNHLTEVRTMLAERVKDWTRSWKEQGLEEGRKEGKREGLHEGRQEGRLEGEALLVRKLLRHRFGELPDWVEQRVATAGTDQLEAWAERVLDAPTLEEVFAA